MANYLDQINPTPDAIWFSSIPPSSQIGNRQVTPFTISISGMSNTDHVIDLYAQYSRSNATQDPQNKWSHLVPQWRFTDLDGNVITKLKTTDTMIFSGTTFLGVTGEAQFYYVDDISSTVGFPTILWATMEVSGVPVYQDGYDVPSYANSKVITYLPYYVNGLSPHELQITRNGIDPMSSSVYFVGQNIPHLITINGNASDCGLSSDGLNILYDYPSSNALGNELGVIDRNIINLANNLQHWTSLDTGAVTANFQAYDSNGFRMGGYSRNNVIADQQTLNTQITAGVNIQAIAPFSNTPFIWVSNPNNTSLHQIYSPYVNSTVISQITSWLAQQNNQNYLLTYETPFITERIQTMSLTGFGGIYGIAVDTCYNIWCSDSEMDKIYKFHYTGQLLSTIDLSDTSTYLTGITGGCTPAGLSLDSDNGLWVALFDSASALKFDRTTGQLLTTINPQGNQISPIGGFGVDPDMKPTLVETDKNDNVWISYTNSMFSQLRKYGPNGGTALSTIILPLCSNPMDMVIDYDNNLWVTLTYNSFHPTINGAIVKYNTSNSTLASTFSASHPAYLTMDNEGNMWCTHSFNNVKRINISNSSVTDFTIGSAAKPAWYDTTSELNYNCLEGIACDSVDRIWVINAYENTITVLSGNQVINTLTLPDAKKVWQLDEHLNIVTLSGQWEKSLQAFGDWTGLRWAQKFNTSNSTYLTGASDVFSIENFGSYDIRKFNESWDATTQIRNYALPEHLYNYSNLFVNYIGTMIGGLETSANSIARRSYERIANYVANHSDIDTANVEQVYGLADKLNVPIDEYKFHYPVELKRLMDITSIPHKVLWGDRCRCNTNFKTHNEYCVNCGHIHPGNRGEAIDTTSYTVSANVAFLAEYRFNRDEYEIINPMVSSSNIFAVASGYLLNSPIEYCYYEYDPTPCLVQNEGVISWDDEYTTLSENLSSLEAWYGNGQVIEKMLSYWLRQGLGF